MGKIRVLGLALGARVRNASLCRAFLIPCLIFVGLLSSASYGFWRKVKCGETVKANPGYSARVLRAAETKERSCELTWKMALVRLREVQVPYDKDCLRAGGEMNWDPEEVYFSPDYQKCDTKTGGDPLSGWYLYVQHRIIQYGTCVCPTGTPSDDDDYFFPDDVDQSTVLSDSQSLSSGSGY